MLQYIGFVLYLYLFVYLFIYIIIYFIYYTKIECCDLWKSMYAQLLLVTEQVFIFLHIIGHNMRFHVMGSRIYRSTETIHRYFKVILRGVLKLYRSLIRLRSKDTPPEIRNSRRFYPYFKVNIATCVFL